MLDVMERVSYFCVFELAGSATERPSTSRGRAAAVKHFEKMRDEKLETGKLSLKQMEPLVSFQWLLSNAAVAAMKKWVDDAVAEDMVASATVAVNKGRGKGSKGARKKTSGDARKMVMDCLK